MPDEEKKLVPIDTSGPDAEIAIEEVKDEAVIDTENTEQETGTEEPVKEETKKSDEELEDYSKGVQSRIAKLTRKMREAERREQAAIDYARGVEEKRKLLEQRFEKTDADYVKKFETSISTGLEAAQKELAAAIESGDAAAQVEANKRIATLAFENAKLEQTKAGREEQQAEKPVLSQPPVQTQQMDEPINPDPRAEQWASNNSWFGTDKAMTYTAFEIHKDLTEKEGYDPNSNEYYAEVDRRIRVDFPHKFDKVESNTTERAKPVQNVASAKRSASTGRKKTVKLTPSQVAIAKKLGVPLEDYAKQLNITEGV